MVSQKSFVFEVNVKRIVFFDGVCVLCNGFVSTLLSLDKKKILKFAPLQGKTSESLIPQFFGSELTTLVYLRDKDIFTQSDAVIFILYDVGGIYKCAKIFQIIPKTVRDKLYIFVARNRYKWFGKKDACKLLTGEQKNQMLE